VSNLTLNDVKRSAAKFNGTVEISKIGHDTTIYVNAPPGFVWSSEGIHCLTGGTWNYDKQWLQDVFKDLIKRINYGITKCENAECDICEEDKLNVQDIINKAQEFNTAILKLAKLPNTY